MQEFYITDDGIRLHAKLERVSEARGPLAIVLHGLTGHMEEAHIIGTADTFREVGVSTLRVELYGHGQSDGAFRDHTLFKWLTNVMKVVDTVKTWDFVTNIYLAGHSQGGLTTILAAGMRPDAFKAILPLAPAINIVEGAKAGNILGMTFDPDHVPDEIGLGDRVLNGNYIRTAQMLNVTEAVFRYHGPVLLVHGSADFAVPIEGSRKLAKLYDQASVVEIPGDDHCYTRHLDQVLDAIKTFMTEQERA